MRGDLVTKAEIKSLSGTERLRLIYAEAESDGLDFHSLALETLEQEGWKAIRVITQDQFHQFSPLKENDVQSCNQFQSVLGLSVLRGRSVCHYSKLSTRHLPDSANNGSMDSCSWSPCIHDWHLRLGCSQERRQVISGCVRLHTVYGFRSFHDIRRHWPSEPGTGPVRGNRPSWRHLDTLRTESRCSRCLTLPSRGLAPAGFACLRKPLMSNVRPRKTISSPPSCKYKPLFSAWLSALSCRLTRRSNSQSSTASSWECSSLKLQS